jgi:hypothetical protein
MDHSLRATYGTVSGHIQYQVTPAAIQMPIISGHLNKKSMGRGRLFPYQCHLYQARSFAALRMTREYLSPCHPERSEGSRLFVIYDPALVESRHLFTEDSKRYLLARLSCR